MGPPGGVPLLMLHASRVADARRVEEVRWDGLPADDRLAATAAGIRELLNA